jgi:large subunit ribosomal protein L32
MPVPLAERSKIAYIVATMVVRMRVNRSKTGKRRSHHGLASTRVSTCECGELRQSHRACPSCGKYNGKVAVDIVEAKKREQRRAKRKQTELRASGQQTEKKETEATK